jgi:hypothetical protein
MCVKWYRKWHQKWYSHHVHTAVLGVFVLTMVASLIANLLPGPQIQKALAASGSFSQTTFTGSGDGTYTNALAANSNADVGLAVTAGFDGYYYRKQIIFNTSATGANVATNQTNFPIAVHINASSWATAADRTNFFGAWNVNGKRAQFFDPSDAALSVGATSAVRATNVVTVTVANSYAVGDRVVIAGMTDSSFNGTFTLTGASGANFTYAQTGANATTGSGTARRTLSYEVSFYNSGTPEAVYWVKVPQVDGNSTTDSIYVNYGNDPYSADQDNKNKVWSNGYLSVWHFDDANGSTTATDSTSSAKTLSRGSGATTIANPGVGLLQGGSLTTTYSTTDYWHGNDSGYPSGNAARTFEGVVKMTGTQGAANGILFKYGMTGQLNQFYGSFAAANANALYMSQWGGNTYVGTLTTNTWKSIAHTMPGGSNQGYTYIDGALSVSDNTLTWNTVLYGASGIRLGYYGGDATVPVVYDELRMSNVTRSADWLKLTNFTTKKTSWNGDNWLTLGSQAATYVSSGTFTTSSVPTTAAHQGKVYEWGALTASSTLNGQTITYDILDGTSGNVVTATGCAGTDRGGGLKDCTNVASGTTLGVGGLNISSYTNTSLKVRANMSGSGSASPFVNDIAVAYSYDTTSPSVPTALATSSVSSTGLTLSWTAATDSESGLANPAYKIERAPESAGYPGTWAQIGTSNTTSYVDSGLSAATKYYYRVRATDSVGNNSSYSGEFNTDANTVGLWHLNEAGGTAADSSGAGNTATPSGTTVITTGKIGNSRYSGATTDKITTGNVVTTATNNFALEAWVKWDGTDTASNQMLVYNGNAGANGWGIFLSQTDSRQIHFLYGGVVDIDTNTALTAGTWTHIAMVRNSGTLYGYLNGSQFYTGSVSTPLTPTTYTYIFGDNNANDSFRGAIDEVRISNVVRSAGDISTYYAESSPQPKSAVTLGVTTPTGLILSSITGSSAKLDWNANADTGLSGYKIERATDSGGNPTGWAQVRDNAGAGTTWTDTTLSPNTKYYYRIRAYTAGGNSGYSGERPADSNTVGLWHLNGATSGSIANGTTAGLTDSSGNNNNGTASNVNTTGMAWSQGKLDGSVSLDGTDDTVLVPDSNSLDITSAITMEAWIKPSNVTGTFAIAGKRDASLIEGNYVFRILNGELQFIYASGGAWNTYSTSNAGLIAGSSWYHVAVTCTGSNPSSDIKVYKNGTQLSGSWTGGTGTTAMVADDNTFGIGRMGDYINGSSYMYNGLIDEVRLSNVVRSGAEIAAYYADSNPQPLSATTLPGTPASLTATVISSTQINLTWTAPAGGVDHYHVYRNGSQLGGDVATTSLNDTSALSPNTSYTYTVRAVNASNQEGADSNSQAKYTFSPSPSVNSSKNAGDWSNTTGITFTNNVNSGTFGVGGVQYYRYAWDQSATHVWTESESTWTTGTESKTLVNGSNYFHVKSYNFEDVSSGTLDLGPYKYDGVGPSGSVAINSSEYSNNNIVDLTLSATDAGSGVYQMRFSNSGAPLEWTAWEAYGTSKNGWDLSALAYGGNASQGTKTVYVEYSDNATNTTQVNDTIYWDGVSPSNSTSVTSVKLSGEWDKDSTPTFNWSGATDPAPSSGIKYWVYFGTDNAAVPKTATDSGNLAYVDNANSNIYSGTTYTAASALTSGQTYYLKIQTVDNSLNDAPSVYVANQNYFVYKFDSDQPELPAYIDVTPPGLSTVNSYDFSWPAASDNPALTNSGICKYEYRRDNGTDSWTDLGTTRSIAGIQKYKAGTNIFQVRATDCAGNATTDDNANHIVSRPYYFSDPTALKAQNLQVDSTHSSGGTVNSFKFTWDAVAGASKYYIAANSIPTEASTFVTNPFTGYSSYATQQGSNTFYVVALDSGGNANWADPASVSFSLNTTAPSAPTGLTISDASNRSSSMYALTVMWAPLASPTPDFDGYVVQKSTDGLTFTQAATVTTNIYSEAGLTEGQRYYFRVRSKDNAGNVSSGYAAGDRIPTGKYTVPPTITTEPKVEVKAASATITWDTNRSSNSIVQFGPGNGYGQEISQATTYGFNHTIDLAGLTPGLKYHFRVASIDKDYDYSEDDAFSNDYTFTTLQAPGISNVTTSEVRLYSAIVTWKTTSSATSRILYGTSNAYGSTYEDNSGSQTTTHTVKLDKLTDSTTYHYKIQGIDVDGNILTSDDYVFNTLTFPKLDSLKVEHVPNSRPSTTKVTFNSNVPTSALVSFVGSGGKDVSKYTLENAHQLLVTGLADDTSYNVVAKGRDAYGNESLSLTVPFRTPFDTTPPLVTDITVETSILGYGIDAKGQVVISWTTDKPSTSQVEYGSGVGSDTYSSKTQEDSSLTETHVVIISDLKPSSPYHFRVVSRDKSGNIGMSGDNSVLTQQASQSVLDLIIKSLQSSIGWIFGAFAKGN